MELSFEVPLNPVSFGQVSTALLREAYARNLNPSVFPIGNVDLSAQEKDDDFFKWLQDRIVHSFRSHKRETPCIKLWHINGGLSSISNNQVFITFYEVDSPTPSEVNVVKQNTTVFTSNFTKQVFDSHGASSHYVPLGFDKYNFKRIDKEYFSDGRVVFNLCGKLEKRKHHKKIIRSWLKRFGDDSKYFLQCSIFNTFIAQEENIKLFNEITGGKSFFNLTFLNYMPQNSLYNDFLNSGDIVLGMSGGEGWALPEFHSVALGKHAVLLNAHVYKDWANSDIATMINPCGKIDSEDGMFFKKGQEFNQGSFFDFDEDEFIHGCEEVIKRVEENRINEKGLELQDKFTYSNTLDKLIELT